MKVKKLLPRQINDAIFYVTYYEDGMINGWLSHPKEEQPLKILSLPQLLFTLENILSREDMPVGPHAFANCILPDAPIAIIRLRILFREHHTWQGCIIWEDQQMEAPFRSVLELIELLDEIMAG